MNNAYPRAPESDVERLRQLVDDASLTIEFDPVNAEAIGGPSWSIYAIECGRKTWLVDWPRNLDGNINAIAGLIRAVDYRHISVEKYAEGLDAARKRKFEAVEKRIDAMIQDANDYAAPAIRAFLEGRPSIGSYGPHATGKA